MRGLRGLRRADEEAKEKAITEVNTPASYHNS